jgi:hypothetical protein
MAKYYLSKSTYLRGLQCEKSLYLYKHRYDLKDEITEAQQAIFTQGTSVGVLAHQLFAGGVNCEPEKFYEYHQALLNTQTALRQGASVLYEAAFSFNGVFVYADILVEDVDGWKVYEVKSSTSVKDTNIQDASLQAYVITNSGIALKDISIVHINNGYVRQGPIEIDQLFTKTSIWHAAQEWLPTMPHQIERLKKVIDGGQIPEKPIGVHCFSPYACDFMGYCWKEVPKDAVFDIHNLRINKKFELYDQGIVLIKDIPEDAPLTEKQLMQVTGVKNNTSHIDKENISVFLEALKGPLYFLDFETIAPAVPLFDNSRPYQQLPFQYSLHIQLDDQSYGHREFLAETDGRDPREDFIKQLITDCGNSGDIIVYNQGFEQSKIENLIIDFPSFKEPLERIIDRLKDLMVPFQKGWLYVSEMKGSYSIKYVLPALVPNLSYDDLSIKEGASASGVFLSMAAGLFEGDFDQTRKDLLAYCKMDTWAMVEILRVMRSKVGS